MTFSPSAALTLASEAEEDERNATPGPWGVYQPNAFEPVQVNSSFGQLLTLEPWEQRPDECEPEAHAICNMRNRNPQVASMLRAAVARVEELEKERDNWRDHCQGISDLFDPLHHNVTPHSALIVARAAKDAHLQVRADRDSLRAKLAEATKYMESDQAEYRKLVEYQRERLREANERAVHQADRAEKAEAALGEMTKERDWAVAVQRAALESQERLGTTLAAALRAKEEACRLLEGCTNELAEHEDDPSMLDGHRARITELRSVGKEKP
jgi:hypothetical protein